MEWSDQPAERLKQLESLNDSGQMDWLHQIAPPERYGSWPYGMPSSPAPLWVVIGLSPGAGDDKESPACATNDRLAFGSAPRGLFWESKTKYFDKVRSIFKKLGHLRDPNLSEDQCLALSGHLNLGTGQSGDGSKAGLEKEIIQWISPLLANQFRPAVVVLFGWKKRIDEIDEAWRLAKGGLSVNWKSADQEVDFQPKKLKYKFRIWGVKDSFGRKVQLIMWPNHPSQPPFVGGEAQPNWVKSLNFLPSVLSAV